MQQQQHRKKPDGRLPEADDASSIVGRIGTGRISEMCINDLGLLIDRPNNNNNNS